MNVLSQSLFAWLALLGFAGLAPARADLRVAGPALGTRYAVRVVDSGAWTEAQLQGAVEGVMSRVDAELSTWREDSELMRFNRSRDTRWQAVSEETARVARAALEIAGRSAGAFDPTVGPLVRLWGFGAEPAAQVPPARPLLEAARAAVGYRHLHVRERPPALRKDRAVLELDLSGIAKGHAVDAVAARLLAAGSRHFMVELGGEVRAVGRSPRGGPWVIGLEDPLAPDGPPARRVSLRDAAVSTSGAYRNFVVRDGARLPHVLDPRTGAPLATDLLAVSVVAPSAMEADGWATALLVAGAERGFDLARREGLAAAFVTARAGRAHWRANERFEAHWTPGSPPAASKETRP
jgi:thiamine biosynthesis lipoprotein